MSTKYSRWQFGTLQRMNYALWCGICKNVAVG